MPCSTTCRRLFSGRVGRAVPGQRCHSSRSKPSGQHRCPAAYYRGGTSRAVIFEQRHLPQERGRWDAIFRAVIGSPDAAHGRQLDGMGGGISSLSKVCVVGPSSDAASDVDYTFAAIGVRTDEVDFSSNCGNMSSAIGPFAVEHGLVQVEPGARHCVVRIRNTNTDKIIRASFPVDEHGGVAAYGDFQIDGVPGTAPMIKLAFVHPAGSRTGAMFPTGSVTDTFDGLQATCIDVGNPCVFVSAADLNVPGDISPAAIDAHPTLLQQLDSIRRQAGVRMGLAGPAGVPASVPKIAMVSLPKSPEDGNVVVRAISVGQPHRAVPITVALAIAAAAKVRGSCVQRLCLVSSKEQAIAIAQPSGKTVVSAEVSADATDVSEASVMLTARLLMKGEVFWRET